MGPGKYLLLALSCVLVSELCRAAAPADIFAGSLLKTLFDDASRPDNLVSSPVSLYVLLGLLQQGSGGVSQTELTRVLNADPEATRQGFGSLVRQLRTVRNDTTLELANKIFAEESFQIEKTFRDIAVNDFDADIENVEFLAPVPTAKIINDWVSENTHGRIPSLVPAEGLPPETVVVLLNAIYFNGKWLHSFNANETQEESFTTLQGTRSTASMMHLRDKLVAGELPGIPAKYVRLPFKDDDFSLIAVVPDVVDGLPDVIASLNDNHLANILQSNEVRTVDLKLPKFKFSTTSKLVPILKKMNLESIFTGAANLTGISRSAPLTVSDVLQKAEIEVDEEGATASAVTGIGIVITSVMEPPPPLIINADRPFAFFIVFRRCRSWPLFAGWVGDP